MRIFKSILRSIAQILSRVMPRSLQVFIYRSTFGVFKLALSSEKGKLWYRNSLYFKDIVFGVSDIDMTFLQEKGNSSDQVKRIEKKLKFWKIFLPHLGEINYYSPDTFDDFLPLANSIELERDPVLLALLSAKEEYRSLLPQREVSDEQVFILNWLASDFHRMRENYSWRQRKIERFFTLLGDTEGRKSKNLSTLLQYLSKNFFKSDQEKVENFLVHFSYFEFEDIGSINLFYEEHPELIDSLLCLYPQKWLGASLHHQRFEEEVESIRDMKDELQEILIKQIRWECWGLLSQWMRSGDDVNFHVHVENLIRMLAPLGERADKERAALKRLSSLHETAFYQESLCAS